MERGNVIDHKDVKNGTCFMAEPPFNCRDSDSVVNFLSMIYGLQVARRRDALNAGRNQSKCLPENRASF